jgi:Family of unknown function (DUF6527)
MKFSVMTDNETEKRYAFHCPGCEHAHWVRSRGNEPRWNVSGVEEDRPTVSPSILTWNDQSRCHSFVRDGKIEFLSDCTHALAGQTVELPDFDE